MSNKSGYVVASRSTIPTVGSVFATSGVPGFWYGKCNPNKCKVSYYYIDMGVYLTPTGTVPIPLMEEMQMWHTFFTHAVNEHRLRRLLVPSLLGLCVSLVRKIY